MEYRILGRTNLKISAIGLGGIPIQRASFDEAVRLIKNIHQYGVNFVDTGIVYTDSEAKIGSAIKGVRQEWILASKSPAISYSQMKKDIEQSLKNLDVDYIDLYQIHHLKNDEMLKKSLTEDGCMRVLKEAQKEGKIGFIGVSGHNNETLLAAAKTGLFDTILLSFNYREQEALKELIPYCKENNIGVMVMKPLAGGTIKNASSAIKFCLSVPGISTVLPGMHTDVEVEEDLVKVLENPVFAPEDEEKLKAETPIEAPFCRACGYCITMDGGCPAGINITLLLRLEGYFQKYGPLDWILNTYKNQKVGPVVCIFCGHCEKVCPFGLFVPRILRGLKIREYFEKQGLPNFSKKNLAGPQNYLQEYEEFVKLAKEKLGENHEIPLALFKLPRPANEGQKATVRGLFREMQERVNPDEKKMKEILEKLCQEMGISSRGVKNFENILALADYNTVVDLMRVLPIIQ